MDLKSKYPPKKGKKPTHFFMDGGVLHVPQDKLTAFSRDYINAVSIKDRKVCLVESCDPNNFNYFLDLDYKSEKILNLENVEEISKNISKILEIGRCLVLVSEPRKLESGIFKSGVHIVWPGKVVNIDQALEYRDKLIANLGENWEQIIDTVVYRGGLRPPWAWKYDNRTKTYHKPYIPIHIVNDDNEVVNISPKPDEYVFRMASIIVPPNKREGWFDSTVAESEVSDNEITQQIEVFIRMNTIHHKKAEVKRIWKSGDKHIIINLKSKYCENKGGSHSSNHTYFVIDKMGHMYQKCHDELCKEFRGREYLVPKSLRDKLFSD